MAGPGALAGCEKGSGVGEVVEDEEGGVGNDDRKEAFEDEASRCQFRDRGFWGERENAHPAPSRFAADAVHLCDGVGEQAGESTGYGSSAEEKPLSLKMRRLTLE